MIPLKFDGCNVNFAENQPQYSPLPAMLDKENGVATFCWRLTLRERLAILFRGILWHQVMTFNQPLQPQHLSTDTLLES